MSARGNHYRDPAVTRKVARLYVSGEITLADAAERAGVSKNAVWMLVKKILHEERASTPEDELTC